MFDQLDPQWSKPVETKQPKTWEEWLLASSVRAKEVYVLKADDLINLLRKAYMDGVEAANAAKGVGDEP